MHHVSDGDLTNQLISGLDCEGDSTLPKPLKLSSTDILKSSWPLSPLMLQLSSRCLSCHHGSAFRRLQTCQKNDRVVHKLALSTLQIMAPLASLRLLSRRHRRHCISIQEEATLKNPCDGLYLLLGLTRQRLNNPYTTMFEYVVNDT
jgi:hypothetical protein